MIEQFANPVINARTTMSSASRSGRKRHLGVAFLCLCGLVASATPTWAQGIFTAINAAGAGTGMFDGTLGISINASGDVTGFYVDSNFATHGFVLPANGTVSTFSVSAAGTSSGQGTFPLSINASGVITGMYIDANRVGHGFIRASDGTITLVNDPQAVLTGDRGTYPTAIDAAGDVAGFYKDSNATRHGFVRAANGTYTQFDVTGAGSGYVQGTTPVSMNASGVIAGVYADSNGVDHGFSRATDGTVSLIDAPGAETTVGTSKDVPIYGTLPLSINAAGDITGIYKDSSGNIHGFLHAANGTYTNPIDAPGAGTSTSGGFIPEGTYAFCINAQGVISGSYIDANGVLHGFVRSPNGSFTAPIDDPSAGAVGTSMIPGTAALGINDSGILTGGYFDPSGVGHGFVLTLTATATPTLSVVAGSYPSAQTVTISDATSGAAIYYTTDGTTPTVASTPYTAAITVSSTETLQAIAIAPGYSTSAVATALYTIGSSQPTAGVAPGSLMFSAQAAGTTSTSQTVKLSNTGSAALSISSISIGANFGQTNNCGSSVAASAFCTITVTFTPTTTGPLTGTLTITDNSNGTAGSMQTVSLTGTGEDFSFGPPSGSPISATTAPGSPATYTLSLTGQGGFAGAVNFTCAGAPSEATCSVSPNPATIGGTATNVTVSVTTTAPSMGALLSRRLPPGGPSPQGNKILLTIALMLGLAWTLVWRNSPAGRRRPGFLIPLCAGLLLAVALTACGGGGGTGNVSSNPGTPAGTYTLTVTGTTGSGSSAFSHAVTLTLKVS